jgi:DNA-binding transcriptional ArsR family regulator
MAHTDFDVADAAARVAHAARTAGRDTERLASQLRHVTDGVPQGSYANGAADALLAVLEHTLDTRGALPSDLPFERGSLAARLLLEIAAGIHGANTDLAERLGTDKTQLSRAGRRLRQLHLAEYRRDGRLNRWTVTPAGTAVASRLRQQ